MNEATTSRFSEFVFRRLTEPLKLFGYELNPYAWCFFLAVLLVAAFFYIGWMYLRDSRGVGPWWATFLGLLRATVYLILAFVFLLPAQQSYEQTETRSKVLVLLDSSLSMVTTYDDVPKEGQPIEKMKTRQDKVLDFLTHGEGFFKLLEKKNPTTAFRFGVSRDEEYVQFVEGGAFTKEEWDKRLQDRRDDPHAELPEPRGLPAEYLSSWLKPTATAEPPEEWVKAERDRFAKLQDLNKKLLDAGLFSGTNVGDSVLSLVNREMNNMVQGIVVFTDGRSTHGSAAAIGEIEKRAKSANIPVFVVAVGEERPQVKIEIVDLRVPPQVQPEDTFRVVAEVSGLGLPEKEFKAELEVTYTKKGANNKEESLEIVLVESEEKGPADKKPGEKKDDKPADKKPSGGARNEIPLGTKLRLQPSAPPKFDKGTPPRAEIEFVLSAAALAKAAGIDLATDGKYAGKKWEIGETREGELKFQLRIPKDPAEILALKEHVSEKADLRVIKRPLRVLLFASGPTHDFQFLNNLLIREVDKGRAELTLCVQPPPGRPQRTGVVLGVDPERLLKSFPDKLDAPGDDPKEKVYDLSEYDVIVAFDPDWTQLSEQTLRLVERWVDKGGGLIAVGGPINTLELARPRERDKEYLKPILNLYPVVLSDIRLKELDRKTTDPWPLIFETATEEMEFLKLADETSDKEPRKFLSDWDEFFYGPDGKKGPPVRGFFNFYPVDLVKPGSQVVARFGDPLAKMNDGQTQQPFLVLSDPASGRHVVWIGWGETRRLRQYKEQFHERFWTKLLRYAGSGNQGKITKRIIPDFGRVFVTNQFIEMKAKIDNKGGEPLPKDAKPEVKLTLPAGVNPDEIPTKLHMTAVPNSDGYFSVRFQTRSPGDYTMDLKVPETGDTYTHKFKVNQANPELDNTRPDFETMYKLASPATEVLNRLSDENDKRDLRTRLTRPKVELPKDADAPKETKEEVPRLYFTLDNADLIPRCMKSVVNSNRNRGLVEDLWDGGWVLWDREPPDEPIKMPYVLAAVVGLLSVEWLTRKLLRLA
jgi:hypothetical protein